MSAKAAIVFGGSRSVGAATTLRLAKDGFDVALTYPTRPEAGFVTGSAIIINGGLSRLIVM